MPPANNPLKQFQALANEDDDSDGTDSLANLSDSVSDDGSTDTEAEGATSDKEADVADNTETKVAAQAAQAAQAPKKRKNAPSAGPPKGQSSTPKKRKTKDAAVSDPATAPATAPAAAAAPKPKKRKTKDESAAASASGPAPVEADGKADGKIKSKQSDVAADAPDASSKAFIVGMNDRITELETQLSTDRVSDTAEPLGMYYTSGIRYEISIEFCDGRSLSVQASTPSGVATSVLGALGITMKAAKTLYITEFDLFRFKEFTYNVEGSIDVGTVRRRSMKFRAPVNGRQPLDQLLQHVTARFF